MFQFWNTSFRPTFPKILRNSKKIEVAMYYNITIFKPGVHGLWPHVPGFLKLLWFVHWYVCVCLCVSAPKASNNKSHERHL